ncbi:hypothetical protein LOZ65_001346 [Ophidiomyces ophidiicola]|nr:hypothetical protein LOZ65_001346 [Ophidiomyces ophidiicola]
MSLDSPRNSSLTVLEPVQSKKRSYAQYLSDIDSRFHHLTSDVFPYHPYLLTVPSERPYRLGSQTASNWAVGNGCLFAPEEEQLQYLTFLSRQAEDTLLVAVGGWSDENGNIMAEEPEKPPPDSTAPHRLQKKKITFNDYKKKALESPAPPTPTTLTNGKMGHSPHSEEAIPAPRAEMPSSIAIPTKYTDSRKRDTAPPVGRPSAIHAKKSPSKPTEPTPPPPIKRPRQDINNDQESKPISTKTTKNSPAVPELLSPTLPPATISSPFRLPPLLSPTLPPELEEELLNLAEPSPTKDEPRLAKKTLPKSTVAAPNGSAKSTKLDLGRGRSASASSTATKGDLRAKQLNGSTSKAAVKNSPIPPPLAQRPVKKIVVPAAAKAKPVPSSTAGKSVPATPAKPKLITKLKYGRQNKKRVEALLRMPKRGKPSVEKPPAKQRTQEVTPNRKETKAPKTFQDNSETSIGNKRPKPSDGGLADSPALKRPKTTAVAGSERPPTPSVSSTSKAAGQQPKAQFAAPRKEPKTDGKSTVMRRTGSSDSELKTPTAKMNYVHDEKQSEKTSPTLSSQSNKSHDSSDWRAWRDEWMKFKDIGREVKHASDRLAMASSHPSPEAQLSAVTALEGVLCFILAFIAEDKCKSLTRQIGDSANWRSLIPYWQAVANRTAPYPHINGLCLLLGAISHAAIHTLDLERLATIAFPSDSFGSTNSTNNKDKTIVSTPGTHDPDHPSPSSSVLAQDSKLFRDLSDLRTRLVESHRESNRLWLEGSRLLPDSVLAREYPATWLRRCRNHPERGREVLKPGRYSGDFYLPLARDGGMGTGAGTVGAIEGVRFASVFLQEWSEKEGVAWLAKLTL